MTAKTDPAQDERERVEEAFRRGIGPVSTCAACAPAVQAALKQAVNVTIGLRADDAKAHARAIAARAVEVAEGMHTRGCRCHNWQPIDSDATHPSYLNCDGPCGVTAKHPFIDPCCEAARDRLRAELAALVERSGERGGVFAMPKSQPSLVAEPQRIQLGRPDNTEFYECGHQKSAGGIEQHDCKD